MEFEPTTLRDLVDHRGLWVKSHLGLGFFPSLYFSMNLNLNKSVRLGITFFALKIIFFVLE